MLSIFKIFTIFGIISKWAEKALEDQVITLKEAAELAEDLGPILGIPVNIDVSTLIPKTPDEISDLEDETRPLPHKTEA